MAHRKHYTLTDSLSQSRHQAMNTARSAQWKLAQNRGELRNGRFVKGGAHKTQSKYGKFDRNNPED